MAPVQESSSQIVLDQPDSWMRMEGLGEELSATESSSEYETTSHSSSSSLESWCNEDDATHFCEECAQRRTLAVPESLPTPVRIALQAACDSVNSGLFGYLNKGAAFRVMSLMAAPAYLPLEVTYSLGRRFAEWVPFMPDDMQWFVREFVSILRDTYEFVQASRHRYSARFTCQLAITELDKGSGQSSPVVSRVIPKISASSETHTLPPNAKRHVNVGFTLDIESKGADPLECVDNMRHRLLEGDDDFVLHQLPPTESVELDSEAIPDPTFGAEVATSSRSRSSSFSSSSRHQHHRHGNRHHNNNQKQHSRHEHAHSGADTTFDTFENCLHIADQMDSILSYYYAEEDNPNVIRVAEIFPLSDSPGTQAERPVMDFSEARDRLHALKDRVGRPRSDSNHF